MHMSKNYVLNTVCKSKVLVMVTVQNFEVIPNKFIICIIRSLIILR